MSTKNTKNMGMSIGGGKHNTRMRYVFTLDCTVLLFHSGAHYSAYPSWPISC